MHDMDLKVPISLRYIVYRILAFCGLILTMPFLAIAYIAVKLDSPGPFFFTQTRTGCDMKPFLMYKIRTMKVGSEKKQRFLMKINEAHGPVFKIRNDPRYTKVGKLLSHTGLDEVPQLINVVMGQMSLVGPRPLPIKEAKKIPSRYLRRFSVLPGMTSEWIIKGSHKNSFEKWMKMDISYAKNPALRKDLYILYSTLISIPQTLIALFFTSLK